MTEQTPPGTMIKHFILTSFCVVLSALAPGVTLAGTAPLFSNSPFSQSLQKLPARDHKNIDRHQHNSILLLDDGYEALLLRVHLIRNATHSIDIQTFIWTNDICGRLMMYELIQAAKRGVQVRIIADHFVSEKDPIITAFLATVHPNIQLKHYRPIASRIRPSTGHIIAKMLLRFRNLNQRMHNKLMVFDNAIALTGGRNIENAYFNYSMGMNFRDRDVLFLGPVVSDASKSFLTFWKCKYAIASRDLIDVHAIIDSKQVPQFQSKDDFEIGEIFRNLEASANDNATISKTFVSHLLPADRVTFLTDKPGKNRSSWLRGQGILTKQIAKTVSQTEHELIIQSPYFILSRKAVHLFRDLRKKKPPVEISVSSNSFGSTDNIAAYSANYRLRSTTIESLGMHVYEFKPHPKDILALFPQYPEMLRFSKAKIDLTAKERLPFLCIHAKSFVKDSRTAYIGSYNLDPRSENLNTEVGLLIEDEQIATLLKHTILRDCAPENSWVIAKRKMPLQLDKVNMLLQGISGLLPIDIWPIRNTSSFELIPGKTAVPIYHDAFYTNFKDVGSFPGAPEHLSSKEISTRLYKAIGGVATPIF